MLKEVGEKSLTYFGLCGNYASMASSVGAHKYTQGLNKFHVSIDSSELPSIVVPNYMVPLSVQESEDHFSNLAPNLKYTGISTESKLIKRMKQSKQEVKSSNSSSNVQASSNYIFSTREQCLLSAFRTVAAFNRSYEEQSGACISLHNPDSSELTLSKSTVFLSKNPELASAGEERSCHEMQSEAPNVISTLPVVQFPAASCHLLWISPVCALRMSTLGISLFCVKFSQVANCFIYPLVVKSEDCSLDCDSTDWYWSGPVPMTGVS